MLRSGPITHIPFHTALTKQFTTGTHRLCDPEETLIKITPHLAAMGITRIADVTGLDHIGIPVCMAVRPNSRSISVSQGKGVTLNLAKASAAMESIESYHAENIDLPVIRSTYNELCAQNLLAADPGKLLLDNPGLYHPDLELFWVRGTELLSEQEIWVPHDAVSLDFTTPAEGGFLKNSNGLASGNHITEAISHAICEVVERDAITFYRLGLNDRVKRLDLATVDSALFQQIFSAIRQAELELIVYDCTHEIGIPSFESALVESAAASQIHPSKFSSGSGTHLSKEVALLRAVTEAIQSRLTVIAGSRDDLKKADYDLFMYQSYQQINQSGLYHHANTPTKNYAEIPSLETVSLNEDVRLQLELIKNHGFTQVLMVDLTKPEFNIPVVHILIPGMNFPPETHTKAHPNERAIDAKVNQIVQQLEDMMQ